MLQENLKCMNIAMNFNKRRVKRNIVKNLNIIIYTVIFTIAIFFTVVNASNRTEENLTKIEEPTGREVEFSNDETVLAASLARDVVAANIQKESEEITTAKETETPKDTTQKETTIEIKSGCLFTVKVAKGYSVNIRESASTESDVVGRLYIGAGGTVVAYGEEWTEISSGNVNGYVSTDFIEFGQEPLGTAVSVEEEKQMKEEAEKESNNTAKLKETEQSTSQTETTAKQITIKGNQQNLSDDDLYLLASLVYCESRGESYEGQLAVANVVLNRLRSGRWGNTLTSVVYADGQFTPAANGKLAAVMKSSPGASAMKAARSAMEGNNNIPGYLFFQSAYAGTTGVSDYKIIGNHVFY